jgi:hypothetical protein
MEIIMAKRNDLNFNVLDILIERKDDNSITPFEEMTLEFIVGIMQRMEFTQAKKFEIKKHLGKVVKGEE